MGDATPATLTLLATNGGRADAAGPYAKACKAARASRIGLSGHAVEIGGLAKPGRLTQAAAQPDFNVGLSVRWLLEHNGEPPRDLLSGSTPFKFRLDTLKRLIGQTFDLTTPEATAAFDAWFQRAHEARALRNDYVHARWGIRRGFDDEEPFAEYVQLNWNMSTETAPSSNRVTFAEFDKQIEELRRLNKDLGELQWRYRQLDAPAPRRDT